MQTSFQKILKKYFIIVFCTLQIIESKAQNPNLIVADSLFSKRNFDESGNIYEKEIGKSENNNPIIYLKLANIAEIKEDFVKELYYLNLYFLKIPNEKTFDKMFSISSNHGFKGYEKNDLNYLIFYYRKFSIYIIFGFVILGIYIFSVLILKKNRKQYIPIRHKFVLILYLLGLFTLINLPNSYGSAIIKNNETILRNFPSNAATVVGSIGMGDKLNVTSKEDIWLRVLWKGNFCYIKTSDVYLIK